MMFKSFLLGALAICSLSANAQDEPKSYSFKVMDNYEKSDILVTAKVGSITPMQFYKNADVRPPFTYATLIRQVSREKIKFP